MTVTKVQAKAMATFWEDIWGATESHQLRHPAIRSWKREASQRVRDKEAEDLCREKAWGIAKKKAKSWTAPGPDCVQGYWWKALPRLGLKLKELAWEMMDGGEVEGWLVEGRTILILKPGCEGRPDQYRPITCLNTAYKLYTGTLAAILTEHAIACQLLPREQKALRRRRRGCLDALVVDGAVAEEARVFKKDLSVAWIDFRKAYDMTPHTWLRKMLRTISPPTETLNAIIALIPHWQTRLTISTDSGTASFPVVFERGLFQGDTLSLILFCLSIEPLSHQAAQKEERLPGETPICNTSSLHG